MGETNLKIKSVPVYIFLLLLTLIICTSNLFAEENKLGIGANYLGVSVRYWLSRVCFEAKGQYGEGIQIYGLRIYKAILNSYNPILYMGLEGDYISFDGEESKGAGGAYEILIFPRKSGHFKEVVVE